MKTTVLYIELYVGYGPQKKLHRQLAADGFLDSELSPIFFSSTIKCRCALKLYIGRTCWYTTCYVFL